LKKQIIEISIEAHRPENAHVVSEAEIDLIHHFLTEIFVEMLRYLDTNKE